jgi:hypothetical protein
MDSSAIERLRDYLRKLAPETQLTVLLALERGILRGENLPALDIVVEELRSGIRNWSTKHNRIGNPFRLFCHAIEPFIVDGAPIHRSDGTIARKSLNPIWSWICRDLVPVDARAYIETAGRALLAAEINAAYQLADSFQNRVVAAATEVIAAKPEKTRRRLTAYMAPPRVLDDLNEMISILRTRATLSDLGSTLPARIEAFEGEQLNTIFAMLRPLETAPGPVLSYAMRLTMKRLDERWQLVRLAVAAAQSRTLHRIAETPYQTAVPLALSDIEEKVLASRAKRKRGDATEAARLFEDARAALRAIESELDLSQESMLSRRYPAIRAAVSGGPTDGSDDGVDDWEFRSGPPGSRYARGTVEPTEAERAIGLVNAIRAGESRVVREPRPAA